MEIKTNFNIDDEVFSIISDTITKVTIKNINININNEFINNRKRALITIIYAFKINGNTITRPENLIFATKEDLIK